ncbi:epidermal growth factor receptor-like [Sitodiplosis mosellana]|uniref:epidermal growth factor receptor-like n=1 Tax=Sitodiplosis mosellana TaxID=263140 RepID=UPI0024453180|nr:epidermal growth factor receptor-like [Sitodiplosis mosellana]
MSVRSNRLKHYLHLRDEYKNCTHIDGNLELTWLEDPKMDLDFLQHIREVTGYVLINFVNVENVVLPSLQIIRGQILFKVNSTHNYSLIVNHSTMKSLELPSLREILSGSVLINETNNLCFAQTIDWQEIVTGPSAMINVSTITGRNCSKCHASCVAGCWGEGAHNCQKFSRSNCSLQCSEGRCFGPNPHDCCHLSCAGGCTGPTNKECLACRNLYDDGIYRNECPEGKYAYATKCMKNCPKNLLKDNGACVRRCSPNKTTKNGECVTCNGPCPKTCPDVEVIHSDNIDSFRNCTIIDGNLVILDQTFNGFMPVSADFPFGSQIIKMMHPDHLEVFSTLREVTGYINIQGDHPGFTNLSYFQNLEVIGGRQLYGNKEASLYIIKTSLKLLELCSLKKINSGAVCILENRNLCKKSHTHESKIINNEASNQCMAENLYCSDECTDAACWGLGPDQCSRYFQFIFSFSSSLSVLMNILRTIVYHIAFITYYSLHYLASLI